MAFVVAALAASLVATAPVAAQPDGSLATTWGAFGDRIVDWVSGLWRIVAGSETETSPTEPVESDSPDSMLLDAAGETSSGTSEPEGEKTPALDPDG